MVAFLVLLSALALAGIVATIVDVSYSGPRRMPTRTTVIR